MKEDNDLKYDPALSLTTRDLYASAALTGLLAMSRNDLRQFVGGDPQPVHIATVAFRLAKAMMEERAR